LQGLFSNKMKNLRFLILKDGNTFLSHKSGNMFSPGMYQLKRLSLTVLDFTSHGRVMFTSHSRPILTSHSRPILTSHDRSMFTTHSRPVFTTVAQSLPRKAEWESERHGANTHELHQRYSVSVT
jgi:hypothetical protein